jgi:hypothetical protein
VADLERADHEGAVSKQAAEQRLLDLERIDAAEVNRGSAAACEVAVQDEDLFRRDGEDGAIPEPDRAKGNERADGEKHGT